MALYVMAYTMSSITYIENAGAVKIETVALSASHRNGVYWNESFEPPKEGLAAQMKRRVVRGMAVAQHENVIWADWRERRAQVLRRRKGPLKSPEAPGSLLSPSGPKTK